MRCFALAEEERTTVRTHLALQWPLPPTSLAGSLRIGRVVYFVKLKILWGGQDMRRIAIVLIALLGCIALSGQAPAQAQAKKEKSPC